MTDGVANPGRRTFLISLTSALGAVGVAGLAVPFVQSWEPSARARNAGAPVKIDISKLEPGQRVVEQWRGQPTWVIRRTDAMLANLPKLDPILRDPESRHITQQPSYARNEWRSIKKHYLVMIGICTHLGCSPDYKEKPTVRLEYGGFFCPCHGSKYDLAGRVYKHVPAPLNMVVPPHSYLSDAVIIVGSEEGETRP